MKKLLPLLLTTLFTLSGCHSNSKDERYNSMGPTEIYAQGVENVNKKNYVEAIEDFEALEARYPFGDYADKAQLGAIYAYYLNEDYPSALPAVERFIRMYPRHPDVDYAHYMKGLIHFSEAEGFFSRYLLISRNDRDMTFAKKGVAAFNYILTTYPDSIYAPDSQYRMLYLRNLLAENEIVAASFYLRKGAYLAAANRANYVIANFDQSPSMPEALFILTQAYRLLELPDLADDAFRVLALNYPDSDYTAKLAK